MRIKTLDGKVIKWNPKGDSPVTDSKKRSNLHSSAFNILTEKFTTAAILQEVSVPIRYGEKLYLDFYIPLHRIAVEVQGEQHYKFVPHFHGTVYGFLQSKKRDAEKKEWCLINNIRLVIFNYNEELNDWRSKL